MIQAECKMQLTYLLGMQSWNNQYYKYMLY